MNTELQHTARWFSGPQILSQDEELWPKIDDDDHVNVQEEVLPPKFTLIMVSKQIVDINRFSSFDRLVRSIAWALRFTRRCRKLINAEEQYGLTADELKQAKNVLFKLAQNAAYRQEISSLKSNEPLQKSSSLTKLSPYEDEQGVLRVGGRLCAASWLPIESRHPAILPPEHQLTLLVVMHHNRQLHHQNNELTIAEIRRTVWIPRLRQILRKVIGNCNECKIRKTVPMQPQMGPLPADRITPYLPPFTHTGLDYFGPITITIGRRNEKRWVALFTCLTIRAIHLEVAKDLSTESCIIVLRNFMNRRGKPQIIRTDKGKNFVGLANDIRCFEDTFECKRIQDELSKNGVKWVFNCPRNPAEGGVWERMVQSVFIDFRVFANPNSKSKMVPAQ